MAQLATKAFKIVTRPSVNAPEWTSTRLLAGHLLLFDKKGQGGPLGDPRGPMGLGVPWKNLIGWLNHQQRILTIVQQCVFGGLWKFSKSDTVCIICINSHLWTAFDKFSRLHVFSCILINQTKYSIMLIQITLAPLWSKGKLLFYPLVNFYITMENHINHHFSWVNQLCLWSFSIANCSITRG